MVTASVMPFPSILVILPAKLSILDVAASVSVVLCFRSPGLEERREGREKTRMRGLKTTAELPEVIARTHPARKRRHIGERVGRGNKGGGGVPWGRTKRRRKKT